MKYVFSLVCVLAVVGFAASAQAQSPPAAQRIVGSRISSSMAIDAAKRVTTDTITLTFQSGDSGPSYTIDFVARHPLTEPVASPGAIDIVVTQHPVEDGTPEMTLRVDGEMVPLVARLHSKRSVVATVSLAELYRITSAGVIVDRTFDTELELGPGQVRMLRTFADGWLARVR